MKPSQSVRSISKSRRNLSTTPLKHNKITKNTSQSDVYFCHFKNAMYMGGIKSFQKHGRGIIIHDNGTSAITSYMNDIKHGHNVYYKENCILSIEFNKNKVKECVLRIPNYLLLIRYNKDNKPEGKALLAVYESRSIYYILFRKGIVVEKREERDQSIVNKFFDLENIEHLVGGDHARALKFDIEKDRNIACQVISNKFCVGFYKKGFMNGLGFILMIKNPQQNVDSVRNQTDFYLKPIERGYFYNSQLHGIGEKWFKNGNMYRGDLKNGVFEGNGILKNEYKNNWVFGSFENGNLSQLMDYSHEGDTRKLEKLLLLMHERKSNWINNQIQTPSQEQFTREIEKILISNPTQEMKNLKQRKQEVLRKIQDNFIYEDQSDHPASVSRKNVADYEDINNKNVDQSIENQSLESTFSKRERQKKLRRDGELDRDEDSPGRNNFKMSQKSPKNESRLRNSHMDKRNALIQRVKDFSIKQQPKKQNQGTQKKVKIKNQNQQVNQGLDSKRLINRSRIFKDFNLQEYQQLPKFNYTSKKK